VSFQDFLLHKAASKIIGKLDDDITKTLLHPNKIALICYNNICAAKAYSHGTSICRVLGRFAVSHDRPEKPIEN
jgi:hypothetical protein